MMAARLRKWLERRTREGAERQWTRLSRRVERLGPASLRRLRDEALGLRASTVSRKRSATSASVSLPVRVSMR